MHSRVTGMSVILSVVICLDVLVIHDGFANVGMEVLQERVPPSAPLSQVSEH